MTRRPVPCLLGLHRWADWRAHEPPCVRGPGITHYVSRCHRCLKRRHRFEES